METPMTQYQFRAGDDVIAADGDKVGNLADVYGTYLVVEKGFFFPRDYYIPFSTVANYEPGDGRIYLSVTRNTALNSGWDHKPDLGADSDTYAAGITGDSNATDRTAEMSDKDHISVPVHQEELIRTKTARQAGQVRVNKDVDEAGADASIYTDPNRVMDETAGT